MLLDYTGLPDDPVSQIIWLGELRRLVDEEIDVRLDEAYFTARLQNQLEAAVAAAPGRVGLKGVLAGTRRHNERVGRAVRWRDGHTRVQRKPDTHRSDVA